SSVAPTSRPRAKARPRKIRKSKGVIDVPVAEPIVEPISLAQAKLHLRETKNEQDELIRRMIRAARAHVETFCRRALVLQIRRVLLDSFPAYIEPERSPLRSVLSIAYIDPAGVLQTLDPSRYRVDKYSEPACITPVDAPWPATRSVTNAVMVTYSAGY